jgi:ketosteroid isomerase-like protein
MRRLVLTAFLVPVLGCSSTTESPDKPTTDAHAAADGTPAAAPQGAAPAANPPQLLATTAAEPPTDDHPIAKGYAAFNDGDFASASKMFAEDAVWQSTFRPGRPFEGRAAIEGALAGWAPLGPAAAAKRMFAFKAAGGEVVIVEGVLAGKHTATYQGHEPTNKAFGVPYAHIAWLNDAGQVTRYVALFNGMSVPHQIGMMEAPRPGPVVGLPLDDTEVVAGPGDEALARKLNDMFPALAAGDTADFAAVLAEDAVMHMHAIGTTVEGKAAILEAHAQGRTASMADLYLSKVQTVAVGDYILVFGQESAKMVGDIGEMRATQQRHTVHVVEVIKHQGGLITEIGLYRDPMELMTQVQAAHGG